MKNTMIKILGATLLAGLGSTAWAIPIVGSDADNSAEFLFTIVDADSLQVSVENTSNFNALITSFGFDITDGSVSDLVSVSGTLKNETWVFSVDTNGPPGDDRDALAITGTTFRGGDPQSGITVGSTGIFDFSGLFSANTTLSAMLVRFQQTGSDGKGSDLGSPCVDCPPPPPPTDVPEPSSIALLGLGLLALGFTTRRRKNGARA